MRQLNNGQQQANHCPSFSKTLPIVFQNIAHDFFKRCPSFFIALPIKIPAAIPQPRCYTALNVLSCPYFSQNDSKQVNKYVKMTVF